MSKQLFIAVYWLPNFVIEITKTFYLLFIYIFYLINKNNLYILTIEETFS